jgi:hypothetical protein
MLTRPSVRHSIVRTDLCANWEVYNAPRPPFVCYHLCSILGVNNGAICLCEKLKMRDLVFPSWSFAISAWIIAPSAKQRERRCAGILT